MVKWKQKLVPDNNNVYAKLDFPDGKDVDGFADNIARKLKENGVTAVMFRIDAPERFEKEPDTLMKPGSGMNSSCRIRCLQVYCWVLLSEV